MFPRRLSSALILAAFCLAPGRASASGGLDVQGWLARPGVKLLAVEFYATWCKPCMAAVPKWKALHDKYRSAGLRLVVVATQDPGGACTNPGWSPDEVVCDDEGVIAKALGAGDSLPAAFLWSWQGHLLVRRGHVEEVDQAIRQWMREVPRLDVDVTEVVATAGINKVALRDMVRTKLEDTAKLDIVASQQEREALVRLKANSLKAGFDEGLACELGKDLSANSLLNVQVTGAGARQRLGMVLLSAERGCMVASSVVEWDRAKPGVSVAEGVAGLMQKLRPDVEMPRGARGNMGGGGGRTPRPGDTDLGGQTEEWQPEQSGNQVIVEFASDPPGAVVLLDGNLLCQDTAQGCSKAVDPGPHSVTMQKERYVKRSERVTLQNGARVEWKLAADFAKIDVRSQPSGLPVTINKRNVGTTPLSGHELSPGTYEVVVADRCYYDAGKRITVARDENKVVEVAMKPREGAINVRAEDTRGNAIAADVYVDGNRVGKSPGVFKLPICARQLEVRHDSYLSFTQDLSIEERKTTPIQAKLESKSGGGGVVGGGRYNASILSPVRGRKAWVQVPSPAERGWCDVVSQAGLIVECDTNNPDQTTQFDLIVRCPNLPSNTFDLIQTFFGQTTERKYDWRSENKCGQYHEITIEIPKSWGLPAGGGGGGGGVTAGGRFDPSVVSRIRGRKVWLQVPTPADEWWCQKFTAAGFEVRCDTDNADQTMYDLIVRCPNLPQDTFAMIEKFVGLSTTPRRYDWRSENACGQYHEITVEIPLGAGGPPGGGGGVAPSGGKYDPALWASIRGRKAWVQVPSSADRAWCDLISRAGLVVDCNTNNDDQEVNFDLIVRCPNLPEDTFDLIERFFGVSGARKYNWRSENACGQYHEITIEIPKTWGHAPSGGGGGGGGGGSGPLAAIAGRKVWLQVPTPAESWWCDKFTAAGVQVTCDTDNADQTNYDLIVRCPNLPSNTFDIIDAFVGRRDSHRYDWRSENKCGEYHEITVEIPR